MINEIAQHKKVILLEPNYKRKYLPLGLAKIATMIKQNGGNVIHQRAYNPIGEDAICITSLFTYDSEKVLNELQQIRLITPTIPVYLGGIFASLMTKEIQTQFPNINIYKGYSKELDRFAPDYSVDWGIEKPWDSFSFVFTSRGCPNKCGYCAVWRIEPDMWINPTWKNHIDLSKPNIMISDNNLSAQPIEHIESVCQFAINNKKHIVFDNGFDCKHITDELASLLGKVKFVRSGMRLAFDRIEENGRFQEAILKLQKNGVSKSSLMAYCLFNFTDTPQEADFRMRECVKLGIRPYPQQYTPLNKANRDNPHIGKYWTKNLLRCFRFFWLMAGYYGKMTFENFVKSDEKYKLNDSDWSAWYSKKGAIIIDNTYSGGVRLYNESPSLRSERSGLCVAVAQRGRGNGQQIEVGEEGIANSITSVQKDSMVASNSKIRRLTPTECERLQGFPDGYTDGISDSQRYKCLGNAVSVPVVKMIGERLLSEKP